jgi:SAM-dependent methyltransferase
MQNKKDDILGDVALYYEQKLAQHGETPRGVDWNGEESQIVRFEQLCKIIDIETPPGSCNDLGCGYGALLDFLRAKSYSGEYCGIDVSAAMVSTARSRFAHDPKARFMVASEPDSIANYGLASGIFNVRLNNPDDEWLEYIWSVLDVLDRTSRHGFAFNCLTSYSDEDKKRDYLFYADPCAMFDFCKTRYSSQVALLHDYGLYEFTILVRKGR